MKRSLITAFFLIFICTGFANAQETDSNRNLFEGQFAPLLEEMGDTHFEISTDKVDIPDHTDPPSSGTEQAFPRLSFRRILTPL